METTTTTALRTGSVWHTRMQSNPVKNAIFTAYTVDATDNNNPTGDRNDACEPNVKISNNGSPSPEDGAAAATGKRRTWNSGDEESPVHIGRSRANPCEDQCRRTPLKLTRPRSNILLHTKKSPVQSDKVRSEAVTPVRRSKSGFSEVKEKTSPVSVKKARSDSKEANERTPGPVRKTRSELSNDIHKSDDFESTPLRKVNSSPAENLEDMKQQPESGEDDTEELLEDKQKNPDDEAKGFGADEGIGNGGADKEDEEDDAEVDEEIEVEKESVDVKEVDVIEKTNDRLVADIKSYNQFRDRTSPCSSAVDKVAPPVIQRATSVYSVPQNPTPAEEQSFPQSQSKLQSLVDLVMWREVSRSALVFGMGTFLIVSSSYAKDVSFSLISVVSYMGLLYLAARFIIRSMIHRGETQREERKRGEGEEKMVREEEVIKMVRVILPYLDEFLLTLRAFFSGDPSTTIKMGVVLFVLARCGSSITIWKMSKLGFFLLFTVPKIFTSYSTYLSAYGEFWVRRFRDAWDSCTHKKAVALAFFLLLWNLSSVVARLWAAFMLLVALRYYQERMTGNCGGYPKDEEEEEPEEKEEEIEEAKRVLVVRKQMPSKSNRIFIPNKLKKSL